MRPHMRSRNAKSQCNVTQRNGTNEEIGSVQQKLFSWVTRTTRGDFQGVEA